MNFDEQATIARLRARYGTYNDSESDDAREIRRLRVALLAVMPFVNDTLVKNLREQEKYAQARALALVMLKPKKENPE